MEAPVLDIAEWQSGLPMSVLVKFAHVSELSGR